MTRARCWLLLAVVGLGACRRDALDHASPLDRLRADPTGKVRAMLFEEKQAERDALVDLIITKAREIPLTDARTIAALRKVPRHAFVKVPYHVDKMAYVDRSVSIGYGLQTISQPSVVASMMQLLSVQPGQKVLEIGTGCGYQAALLAEITPNVYSIEIIKELAQEAADRLRLLGYDTVTTRVGDGYHGWPEAAPFDAIIVTCAAGHIPPPLLAQLAPDGKMVIPVGEPNQVQRLLFVTKSAAGEVTVEDKIPVRFVPMTGGPP